jgi:hypothetical protein
VIDRWGYPGRGGRARRRPLRRPAALAVFALAALPGCSQGDAAARPETAAPSTAESVLPAAIPELSLEELAVEGAATSLDELLRTVERALADRDTTRLLDLMVSADEYRTIIYPALPAAHPPIGASFESIWVTHYPDAWRGLKRVLGRYGGRDVRILAVRFEAADQDHRNFILHETSVVDIEVDGRREHGQRLFGSVVDVNGRWKILSYPDEE